MKVYMLAAVGLLAVLQRFRIERTFVCAFENLLDFYYSERQRRGTKLIFYAIFYFFIYLLTSFPNKFTFRATL